MPSNKYKRKAVRDLPAVKQLAYRPRRPGETLADEQLSLGRLPGPQRCGAIGIGTVLPGAHDCRQVAWGSTYCYYHEKLRKGLMEPSAPVYVVWPLPPEGYFLVTNGK